jgi:hypothetical protein
MPRAITFILRNNAGGDAEEKSTISIVNRSGAASCRTGSSRLKQTDCRIKEAAVQSDRAERQRLKGCADTANESVVAINQEKDDGGEQEIEVADDGGLCAGGGIDDS